MQARKIRRAFNTLIVALPVVVALGFVAFRALGPDPHASFRITAGSQLPAISLTDANGGIASLHQLVGGRGGAIVIMHPTCLHCHAELASFERITSTPPVAERPQVVVVSMGNPVQTADTRAKYKGMSVYMDSGRTFETTYKLQSVPVLLLVAPDLKVREVRFGAQGEEQLRALLGQL